MRPIHLAASAALTAVLAACQGITTGCGCSPAMPDLAVTGSVTAPAGFGLAGARVQRRVVPPGDCRTTAPTVAGDAPVAAHGTYRIVARAQDGPCQRRRAVPAAGSPLRPSEDADLSSVFGSPAHTAHLALRAPS